VTRVPMPAAVLAGGASRRMGRPKASLEYGGATLLEHQTRRLASVFSPVYAVVKDGEQLAGSARVLFDRTPEHAAIHGLIRALEEVDDRVFILAVDLPVLAEGVVRLIADRSLASEAPAAIPLSGGVLQPLAAVWRRAVLPIARERVARGELSLHGLAREVGAEVMAEEEWRAADPSGNSFANVNTLEQYVALRERA
jgi:molybdopterin-guanine dinucleotide biosynthesis protein A